MFLFVFVFPSSKSVIHSIALTFKKPVRLNTSRVINRNCGCICRSFLRYSVAYVVIFKSVYPMFMPYFPYIMPRNSRV